MRQVKHQDVVICGGSKTNIWLDYHLGPYRKAEWQVRKATKKLLSEFGGSKIIAIKL